MSVHGILLLSYCLLYRLVLEDFQHLIGTDGDIINLEITVKDDDAASKELKVEFVDDLKTNIEVRAMVIRPEELIKEKYSRAKKKQEDRKLSENYIDKWGGK